MLLGAFLAILVMLMPASAASVEKRTFWADDGDNTPFVGCYNTLALWTTILNAWITHKSSGDECAAYCNNRQKGFSYWERSTGLCKCAYGEPGSFLGVSLLKNGYGKGSPNNCPGGYWDTRVLRSRYQFKGCTRDVNTRDASFNSVRDRLFFKASGLAGIFRNSCKGSQFLVTHPTRIGIFSQWYCYGEPASAIRSDYCSQDTFYVYSTPSGPVPSGLRRRQEPARIDEVFEQEQEYLADQCLKLGRETCYADASQEHWECVDTQNEQMSCGGCRWGAFKAQKNAKDGINCQAFGDDTTCLAGVCRP
ncbi:delayed-type hypersensitivity antigen - related protein [Trichosporon asahii var. asahii CBS 8904]|uniref:Delayed-type hypersensitivity antigen-related protein n=2 Tax=Trichosporon asahii var. asahii TaxID=189963 RepID=K1VRG6_TRIAC|nr:delayed-type hypersensitivity antigen - related protein [Trichosporon asahii var. asahii CBS 2479]EJT53269.1 delayed-type hypersensitivity antigen - related protein [Trichosporon asahii var. asahii CBS 2479]EKD02072.1 delayed-type hypersensitivity antigen - related protein [Trichosporon asahii var. asahii CBS 8904]